MLLLRWWNWSRRLLLKENYRKIKRYCNSVVIWFQLCWSSWTQWICAGSYSSLSLQRRDHRDQSGLFASPSPPHRDDFCPQNFPSAYLCAKRPHRIVDAWPRDEIRKTLYKSPDYRLTQPLHSLSFYVSLPFPLVSLYFFWFPSFF